MPFDKLPGYNLNAPIQQFSPPPVKEHGGDIGPAIANAVAGLVKYGTENFSPAARRKKELEELKMQAESKKYNNYLQGILDPEDQARIDIAKQRVGLSKRGKPNKAFGVFSHYQNNSLRPTPPAIESIQPPLPEPDLPPLLIQP